MASGLHRRSLVAGALASTLLAETLAGKAARAQASGTPIRIGVILTLGGAPGRAGTREREGIELALKTINGAGGIGGRPVQITVQDDAADPNAAVAAFNALAAQDDIPAIIGATIGSSTLAFAPLAKRAEMPILAPNSTYQITHIGNDFLFRVGIPADVEVAAAAALLKERGFKRIGLLSVSDAYGKQGAELLQADKSLNIVAAEQISYTTPDHTPQLTKIRAANPDVLVLWGAGPQPGITLKNASQIGLDLPVVAPSAASNDAMIAAASGAPLLSRLMVQGVVDAANPEPRQREGIDAYRQQFNADPDYFVAVGWDAMTILGRALKAAGPKIDRASVKAGLEAVRDYEGFGGIYNYGRTQRDGTDLRSIVWLSVVNGRFVRMGKPG